MRRSGIYTGIVMLIAFCMFGSLQAADFKGVTFPDSISVGGKECVLNGIGIRKKFFVKVYYGALYLPYKSSDAEKIIKDDVPKAVIMHVVYKEIGPEKWVEGWQDAFKDSIKVVTPELKNKIDKFLGFFDEPVVKGGEVVISYNPDSGTEVKINGKVKGNIDGRDFMVALWSVWLGDKPVSESLKKGMLGL